MQSNISTQYGIVVSNDTFIQSAHNLAKTCNIKLININVLSNIDNILNIKTNKLEKLNLE